MNLKDAQAIVGKPTIDLMNVGPNWKRPEDLTEEQHQLLDNMHFPREVNFPEVLKKRIPQIQLGSVYLKPTTTKGFSEIKYSVCNHTVAMIQDKALQLSKCTKPTQIEGMVSNYQKSDHVTQYMGREYIEAEMRWVIDALGSIVVPDEIKIEGEPQLTKGEKITITRAKNNGDSAEEIAERLGKPIELIIDWMTEK